MKYTINAFSSFVMSLESIIQSNGYEEKIW
jgi:hypothetical protein